MSYVTASDLCEIISKHNELKFILANTATKFLLYPFQLNYVVTFLYSSYVQEFCQNYHQNTTIKVININVLCEIMFFHFRY